VIICISILLLIIPQTKAASEWTRIYPAEYSDMLTPSSMVQTNDGGYAIALFFLDTRIDNLGYPGHFTQFYQLQIMKIDQTGEIQWIKNFTEIQDPTQQTASFFPGEYNTIVQTADQGYAISGTSSGYHYCFLFKVNSQGDLLWSKFYTPADEESNSSFDSMIKTSDGGFAMAGSKSTAEGYLDFWLVKASSDGEMQWSQTYNSGTYKDYWGENVPREDHAMSLTQTRDGGYALVGSSTLYRASTTSVVLASWMVKTDAQGKQIWNQGYDSPNQNREYQIVQTTDNGYAIAGTQNGETYLMKVDSTGHLQWSKSYQDQDEIESYNSAIGLVQLNDGGYAVAATLASANSTFYPTYHSGDLGLIRYDSSGETTWVKTYNAFENATNGQQSSEIALSMIRTGDGGYAIVGSTVSPNENHQDIFFAKTETLEQTPTSTPLPTAQQTNALTQTSLPTEQATKTPSISNTQTPSASNTINPIQTQTPQQQVTSTPSESQPATTATNGQSESTTQGGISDTLIVTAAAAAVIIIVIAAAIIARMKLSKRPKPD
jgi:hypothetical protein